MGDLKKKWGRKDLVLLLVALIPIAAAVLLYDQLPERMAVHFGFDGNPDGYQGKLSFLVMYGLLLVGMPLLIKLTRFIDPKRANYEKFEGAFEIFRFALTLLLGSLLGVVLIYNLGYPVSIQMFTLIGIGLLFVVLGNYMGQIRFNYFMGIRTPWTLANEEVWRRTHRLAGPLWMAAGLIAIVCAFLPGVAAAWIFGIVVGALLIVPVVYSYVLFQRFR